MKSGRYFSHFVGLAMLVAMLHAALPYVHMASAKRDSRQLVLCTGTGMQVVLVAADSGSDTKLPPGQTTFKSLPCAVCAHAASLGIQPANPAVLATFTPFIPAAPQQLLQPPAKRFAFAFQRGGAPPAFSQT